MSDELIYNALVELKGGEIIRLGKFPTEAEAIHASKALYEASEDIIRWQWWFGTEDPPPVEDEK